MNRNSEINQTSKDEKAKERAQIEQQTKEFLKKGGKITRIKSNLRRDDSTYNGRVVKETKTKKPS